MRKTTHQEENHNLNFLEALFDEQWDRICRIVYSILGDWDEAQDVALETFLRIAYQNPQKIHNPQSWLFRVATNLALNTLRSQKRRAHYESSANKELYEINEDGNPEQSYEKNEKIRTVRKALSLMKKREVQLLVYYHSGFSYREIASLLNVSPNSVGKLLARAEKAFEKSFSKVSR